MGKRFTNAWLDYRLVEPESLTAEGRPIKLYDGMLGYLPVWKTKKACKDAGHSTKNLKRCTLWIDAPLKKK